MCHIWFTFSYSCCKGTPSPTIFTRLWSEWYGFCVHFREIIWDVQQLLVPPKRKGGDLRDLFVQGWAVVRAALGTDQERCHTRCFLGTRCISHLHCHTCTWALGCFQTVPWESGSGLILKYYARPFEHLKAIWLWTLSQFFRIVQGSAKHFKAFRRSPNLLFSKWLFTQNGTIFRLISFQELRSSQFP